jgi:hypothetical protein
MDKDELYIEIMEILDKELKDIRVFTNYGTITDEITKRLESYEIIDRVRLSPEDNISLIIETKFNENFTLGPIIPSDY